MELKPEGKNPCSEIFLPIRCKMCGGRTVENENWQGARVHYPSDNEYPYADDYCTRPRNKLGEWQN